MSGDASHRPDADARLLWELGDIFTDWDAWDQACAEVERLTAAYAALKGTLARSPEALLQALQLGDELGQLVHRVYYYPALSHDTDQRDNATGARRQQAVAHLAARDRPRARLRSSLRPVRVSLEDALLDVLGGGVA